jgi:hypothetical protein
MGNENSTDVSAGQLDEETGTAGKWHGTDPYYRDGNARVIRSRPDEGFSLDKSAGSSPR